MPGSPVPVEPAGTYEAADDLAVVTCFFNSENYQSKKAALERFSRRSRVRRSPSTAPKWRTAMPTSSFPAATEYSRSGPKT